jgi:hypothetical protein
LHTDYNSGLIHQSFDILCDFAKCCCLGCKQDNIFFASSTSKPALLAWAAVIPPIPPAPITTTSGALFFMTKKVLVHSKVSWNFRDPLSKNTSCMSGIAAFAYHANKNWRKYHPGLQNSRIQYQSFEKLQ